MSKSPGEHDGCDFCGLPLGGDRLVRWPWGAFLHPTAQNDHPPPALGHLADAPQAGEKSEARYCCFGCRIAAAASHESGEAGQSRWTLLRLGLAIFCAINVMVFTMALWSQDVYQIAPDADSSASLFYSLFRYLALIFSLPVLFLLGGPLAESAGRELVRGRPSTDLLLALGVAASFVYSLVSVWSGVGAVYFEVGCMVLVAVTLGRWLEATGKLKTTAALRALHKLLPEQVRKIVGRQEAPVPLDEIVAGDVLRILPGERIPIDGQIIGGRAAVDEQVVTGESEPLVKESGDPVLSGTLNLDGNLLVRASAAANAGALQRLVESLTQAALSKGAYQRLADRISAWFLPAVALIAVGVFVVHWRVFDFPSAVLSALAVVVIACPCALGLATPLALWAALGRASREGVLFQSGDALSRLASAKAVCFDKTGTLTTGTPRVHEFHASPGIPREQVLRVAALLAGASNHQLSAAIRQFAGGPPGELPSDVIVLPGRGVSAQLSETGGPAELGNLRLMQERGQSFDAALQDAVAKALAAARPLACVAWGGRVRGLFTFQEDLRPEAIESLDACRKLGLTPLILTGDHASRAAEMGRLFGVVAMGELLPADKFAAIGQTREKLGPVVMVGDGINDAPALAAADVGVALGCGADVARQTADVCLLGNDLSRLPWAIGLARRTVAVIRWNLLWAFLYNTLGIGLAASGWLNPIVAALAMTASSLLVIGNSLRLASLGEDDTAGVPLAESVATPVVAADACLEPKGQAA